MQATQGNMQTITRDKFSLKTFDILHYSFRGFWYCPIQTFHTKVSVFVSLSFLHVKFILISNTHLRTCMIQTPSNLETSHIIREIFDRDLSKLK